MKFVFLITGMANVIILFPQFVNNYPIKRVISLRQSWPAHEWAAFSSQSQTSTLYENE